ncbi:MFS general substrate transporter [Flagelloscypha sp. PMI_526]|nr:MFS general substrate transporter [Flagelloscypha sp. PMI_526]
MSTSSVTGTPLSPAVTLVDDFQAFPKADEADGQATPNSQLSNFRRYVLLAVFCLAQFLDVFNVSSLMAALPSMTIALNMNSSEAIWVVSAFQLTFSAFLLVSGKMSDVFNAKYAFIAGITILSVLSLITGFMHNKIALFVLRALTGVAGSMTIPSSLTLIVRIFPDPSEQGRAISMFGATGAIGNILGLLIGAIFTQYTTWRWVFWFAALLALPAAFIGVTMIPPQAVAGSELSVMTRITHMDIPGVAVLTVAIILFILALTESTTSGWGSAIVIAPLVISIVLVIGFFVYERLIPQKRAAIPYRTWFYKNFSVLFGAALVPYFWWVQVFVIFTAYWQEVYQWSVIMAAVRMLPIGVAGAAMSFTSPVAKYISVKYILLIGYAGMITGTVLLTQADRKERYWQYAFTGFAIGSGGTMITYVFSNIGIFKSTPPAIAGTVGAMFNGALQLGSAVGSAAVTSIQLSVQKKQGADSFEGRKAGFWFVLGVAVLAALSVATLYDDKVVAEKVEHPQDKEKKVATPVDETV